MLVFAMTALPPLDVPTWTAGPFVLLLLLIAILPVAIGEWWHDNKNKLLVAGALGLPVAGFLFAQPHGFDHLVHSLEEYCSFIMLLGVLYVIAGGIIVTGDIPARPVTNTLFLAIGGVLASFIGTTGASMLLIQPIINTNRERKNTHHIPIFFIFIVSNCGGLLTPLGDPPLFLGFLKGVDFFWTLRLWPLWLFVNGLLLFAFLVWDMLAYRREKPADIARDEREVENLRVMGLRVNGLLLVGVVLAVLSKKYLPIFPLAELAMLLFIGISLRYTPRVNRAFNRFSWGPILEVAILFAGIFLTMVPALALLRNNGAGLGVSQPWQFFWLTGLLSSFLDNAPTYVTMGELAMVVAHVDTFGELVTAQPRLLAAISCGAVFMGANTYIGNGPNFMVKAIAEQNGYTMPSFFGYMGYAVLILLPILIGAMTISFL